MRAERDGGPAIERGGSRAHRRRDETVVLRMPHGVRDGDEGSTRARRDVATIPSPGERGEGGRRRRSTTTRARGETVALARHSAGRRVLLQPASLGTKSVHHLHGVVVGVGVPVRICVPFVFVVAPHGDVLRAPQRLLERLPLQHERPRLAERALLRPLRMMRIPRLEVDVHDGYARRRLKRRGEFLRQIERLRSKSPSGVSPPRVCADTRPPNIRIVLSNTLAFLSESKVSAEEASHARASAASWPRPMRRSVSYESTTVSPTSSHETPRPETGASSSAGHACWT